jgi:LacI family transcriptional regulator
VSRVLNQPEAVGDELTSRVHAAMRKLGYMPNSAARTLRSRRSHIMGIVIPTLDYAIYARLVEGLPAAARGTRLFAARRDQRVRPGARRRSTRAFSMERGVEGLVLIGDTHRPELYHLLETTRASVRQHVRVPRKRPHPSIGFDNRRVTSEITDFLWGLGHRAFGVISASTTDNDRASERVAGVKDALERHGSSLLREAVYEHPYSIASGREGFRYLRTLGSPPTAIICGNDVLAMGALIEAHALGVQGSGRCVDHRVRQSGIRESSRSAAHHGRCAGARDGHARGRLSRAAGDGSIRTAIDAARAEADRTADERERSNSQGVYATRVSGRAMPPC